MKGMSTIISDIEQVLTTEFLAELCGLGTRDLADAILQKLHNDGVTDVPALMDWSRDLMGRADVVRVLKYLQLKFDKEEATDALFMKWFSYRGVEEKLQPRARPYQLARDLTEMAQQAAATPAKFDLSRLVKIPLSSLMRYMSLFYWRELMRIGRLPPSGQGQAGDLEVIGMLEEFSLSELCALLNCDAPLQEKPYDPASQPRVILSTGAAGTALSRLADLTESAPAGSSDQSMELSDCLMAILQEWHGEEPYTPKACAVTEIRQTNLGNRVTCYDEMGGTVILAGVTSSLACGDDVLLRARDKGEVWASKPQAVPRNAIWEMPDIILRESLSQKTIKAVRHQVFISYSHADRRWMKELQTHLKPYVDNTMIVVWDDSQIRPGEAWKESIEQALASAKVAVLLVSPAFLASSFIAEHELPRLLEAAESEGVAILWVPVSSSSFRITPIAAYQAAHSPEKPLASLSRAARDKALVKICEMIQREYQR